MWLNLALAISPGHLKCSPGVGRTRGAIAVSLVKIPIIRKVSTVKLMCTSFICSTRTFCSEEYIISCRSIWIIPTACIIDIRVRWYLLVFQGVCIENQGIQKVTTCCLAIYFPYLAFGKVMVFSELPGKDFIGSLHDISQSHREGF